MPLNLVTDRWIPVVDIDGRRRIIAPCEMAEPGLQRPDWPRADLNIACLELLIGLIFLCDPPGDAEDWQDRPHPDAAHLQSKLAPFAPAFNLLGDGPRFLQEFGGLTGEANPPDMLFIDSAGANTAKNNADLMVRRERYPALDPAMALYTFQAHAPSGGAGNRTSLRGGGPMVTLVDPERELEQGLWPLIWANVPDGRAATPAVLPWMRPTRTSETGTETLPHQVHASEAFFGMPRRLWLTAGDDEVVTGVVQRPSGTNYAGWEHPLTPYYRMRAGGEPLPQHLRAGLFGYRHWLGIVAAADSGALRERAQVVTAWRGRSGAKAQVIVAGWAMDNMKPRDFTLSQAPLIDLPPDLGWMLPAMVLAAEMLALSLRGALAPVLAEGEAREAAREDFYTRTQDAFLARLAELTAVNFAADSCQTVARGWVGDMQRAGLAIFESLALPGLFLRGGGAQAAIVAAHRNLAAAFAGYGNGGKAFDALRLPRPVNKKDAA